MTTKMVVTCDRCKRETGSELRTAKIEIGSQSADYALDLCESCVTDIGLTYRNATWEFSAPNKETDARLVRMRREFGRYMDPLNGDAVVWCGECGGPCDVVRPGKTQCNGCDTHRTEIKRLQDALRRVDACISFSNTGGSMKRANEIISHALNWEG